MSLAAEFPEFWAESRADLGNPTFTFNDAAYDCLSSTLQRGTQLLYGGAVSVIELTLLVRASDFATAPVTGDVATYLDVDYRVLKVDRAAAGQHLELHFGAMEA